MSPLELFRQSRAGALTAEDAARLKQLAEAYPYFTLPHLIAARLAAATQAGDSAQRTSLAAIYAHDRRKLAAYLDERYALTSTAAPSPTAKSTQTSTTAPLTPAAVEAEPAQEPRPQPKAEPTVVAPTAPPAEAKAEPKAEVKPAPEAKPTAPEAPQPRYVVKESKREEKPKSTLVVQRSGGEAAPEAAAPTPAPSAAPAPVPTLAPTAAAAPPPPTPPATPVERTVITAATPATQAPSAGPSALGTLDQKLQTVLNVRVGMYVPMAASLAKELAQYKAAAPAKATPSVVAPKVEVAPAAETPKPAAEAAPAPRPTESRPAEKPAPPAEPTQRAEQAKPAAPSTPPAPPASSGDPLEDKIAAMIAAKASDLGGDSSAAGKRGDADRQRPDPNDKLKAPWERRTPKPDDPGKGGSVRPSAPLMNEPVDTGMDQLRRSLLSMIQSQISDQPDPGSTQAKASPAPAPRPSMLPETPPSEGPSEDPIAALKRKIGQQTAAPAEVQSAPPAQPAEQPAPAPAVEAKASDAPAAPQAAAPAPAAVAPPTAERKPEPAPEPARKAEAETSKAETPSLRGSSESMRRFISPEFSDTSVVRPSKGASASEAAAAPPADPAELSVPPKLAPVASAAPAATEAAPELTSDSMRRFVSPEFDDSRRGPERADTTGSARAAALPIKDPASATPPAAKPVEPVTGKSAAELGSESMSRFYSPDFDPKPATLHLPRPGQPGAEPSAPAAAPTAPAPPAADSGMQSASFKRFVSPDFAPTPPPATPAAEPSTATSAAPQPTSAAEPSAAAADSGMQSASFKRFVSPDFSAGPTDAPAITARASEPPPPAAAPSAPKDERSESMRRFVSPDFGSASLAERMETTHGPGAGEVVSSPAGHADVEVVIQPEQLKYFSKEPGAGKAETADKAREAAKEALKSERLGTLESRLEEGAKPEPSRPPVNLPHVANPPSVAETLAAIQPKGSDAPAEFGQVVADVAEQNPAATNDISHRIETFRENLAKLRSRTMPNPSEINLRTIQQKFLDRIVRSTGGESRSGRSENTPPSAEPKKSDDAEGERAHSSAGAPNSVSVLVDRFNAFAPKLAESARELRANLGAQPSAAAEPVGDPDGEGENSPGSETLARILAQQGQKEKARQMLEQLALKMPEKSAYFAALIEQWQAS